MEELRFEPEISDSLSAALLMPALADACLLNDGGDNFDISKPVCLVSILNVSLVNVY